LEVELQRKQENPSIAEHCTRLRALTLRIAPFDVRPPIEIAVCTKSAKTLEYLKIADHPVTDKQIEMIQKTCHALKRISINGNGPAVSKLLAVDAHPLTLASYGNKLERACLHGFTEDDARRVVSACKKRILN